MARIFLEQAINLRLDGPVGNLGKGDVLPLVRGWNDVPDEAMSHPYLRAHLKSASADHPGVDPQTIDQEPTPLGSSTLPDPVQIGDADVPLAGFIESALQRTGLSPRTWNTMSEDTRDLLISLEIDTARATASGSAS